MKQLIIVFLLFSLSLFSCDKKLDLAPEDTLVERDVFKTDAGAEQALAEAYYNLLRAVTGGFAYVYGDFTTSNLHHSDYYDIYTNGEATPADESIALIWRNYFSTVNTANNIILNVPLYAKFEQVKQDQFVAEAKFIRAFAYLDLLKFFGSGALTGEMNGLGLPLQLTPFKGYNTGQIKNRSTNGEVYMQIIKDLQEAINALPEKHSSDLKTRTRATTGSANALLSRVYLYMKNFTEAADAAKTVLNKQPAVYSLSSNLLQIFPPNPTGSAQTLSSEHVFSLPVSHMVSSSTSANNNLGSGFFYKRSFWINRNFIDSFDPHDGRVTDLVFKGDTVFNADRFNERTTFKFNNPNGRDNVPLIRLSEMFLTRAEALAQSTGVNNESVSLLNAVKNRSVPGAVPYSTSDFATKDDLLKEILNQRRLELAFEGFYRYDLIRTNQPLKTPDIPAVKKVLPIPQIEIEISKGLILQNPGF